MSRLYLKPECILILRADDFLVSGSELKSYVITSYALDSTLHAIFYHRVENQRGSLVKQHCLFTPFVGNIIARRTGVVHLEPSYPGFGILVEHWPFCAVLIIYFLNNFLLYLQFLVTVQITLSRQTKEYLMLHPAFDHKA
ncbi:hypothetical protein SFRURICE_013999 [Spodoptera frugiperda]|nr:hypothetical protein SFRURICE_013999 [Spodoptera frugiperda]